MMERRKNGLCYTCDAKWSRSHACASPRLFLIEEVEEKMDKLQEVEEEIDPGDFFFLKEFPKISLHAIIGNPTPKTIRIVGMIKNHKVIILIDSGSTHNFCDQEKVKEIGIQLVGHESIKVKVANGDEIVSPGKCKNTKVKLQGYTFVVDLYVLPLAGCDIVLGIQWLRTLGPILWDFLNLTMQFVYEEKTCLLEGLAANLNFSVEDDESFKLNRSENKGVLLQLCGDEIKQKQGNNFAKNQN
jgi:hypothetical protein